MKKYNQLYLGQRYQIQSLFEVGLSQTEIADQIDVHKSTISRELKRNIPRRERKTGRYVVEHAQRKTDYLHTNKPKRILLGRSLKDVSKGS